MKRANGVGLVLALSLTLPGAALAQHGARGSVAHSGSSFHSSSNSSVNAFRGTAGRSAPSALRGGFTGPRASLSHSVVASRSALKRRTYPPTRAVRFVGGGRFVGWTPIAGVWFPYYAPDTGATDGYSAAATSSDQEPAPPATGNAVEVVAVPPPEPLPDAGEFILVLRDGTRLSAVAFTRQKDQIVYITHDGSRRSLPVSDLDPDSTRRQNEERGTILQLSL